MCVTLVCLRISKVTVFIKFYPLLGNVICQDSVSFEDEAVYFLMIYNILVFIALKAAWSLFESSCSHSTVEVFDAFGYHGYHATPVHFQLGVKVCILCD